MIKRTLFFTHCIFLANLITSGQSNYAGPKGNLFIIGGGDRSPELIRTLVQTAMLVKTDYIVVLPMSSTEPDSSYYYIRTELQEACHNTIVNLNFTKDRVNDAGWIDSLKHARMIFITGGDQTRFMNIVLHTAVYDAIHYAFNNGSTVAGSSAGAAVMSKNMITGNELLGDTTYHETFRRLWQNNIELKEGLGLVDSAIIDQHFVVRSRYNRMLSAIAKFPSYLCIGIDEATAIIIHNKKVTVTGDGQVIVLADPKGLEINGGLIKMADLRFSIYTRGDSFNLK